MKDRSSHTYTRRIEREAFQIPL